MSLNSNRCHTRVFYSLTSVTQPIPLRRVTPTFHTTTPPLSPTYIHSRPLSITLFVCSPAVYQSGGGCHNLTSQRLHSPNITLSFFMQSRDWRNTVFLEGHWEILGNLSPDVDGRHRLQCSPPAVWHEDLQGIRDSGFGIRQNRDTESGTRWLLGIYDLHIQH